MLQTNDTYLRQLKCGFWDAMWVSGGEYWTQRRSIVLLSGVGTPSCPDLSSHVACGCEGATFISTESWFGQAGEHLQGDLARFGTLGFLLRRLQQFVCDTEPTIVRVRSLTVRLVPVREVKVLKKTRENIN